MRLVLAVSLAGLVASPLSVSAQVGEEGAASEPSLEEPAPSSEPAPEEPALKLRVDDAGVEVVRTPPPTVDGYPQLIQVTKQRMDRRMKRAWIGFSVSTAGLAVGGLTILAANTKCMIGEWTESCNRIENAGIIVMSAGGAGMISSGIVLGIRTRQLRELKEAHYRTSRRAQWDLAHSRLVF